ncbi:Rieske 2Fe-2S domain-containing protein [Rhizobium sp. ICMP 5592]|uniref:Rieske (2Fe-2S) protein n=1 Tax=Rhizobium sp. ICMP 5592 TaxID=2292445 RepID=UPI001296E93F|nr:Rieske 2Fe-2S domain-containing protein [Rhizobium sp. ICMP 5592]MQB46109.1 damage-inducible protein CinA [Rhizobium sp. ICMP 5592]
MSDTVLTAMKICSIDDVAEGEVIKTSVEGRDPVAVYKSGGQIYVSNDVCPHAEASLAEGYIEDGRIICPVHFAEFDLGTGEVHNQPVGCGKLKFYTVTVVAGVVYADLA